MIPPAWLSVEWELFDASMFSSFPATVSVGLGRHFWEVFWRSFWLFLASHTKSCVRRPRNVVRSHIFACVLVADSGYLLLAASCVRQPRALRSKSQNCCKIQWISTVLLERLLCVCFIFSLFGTYFSQFYLGIFFSFSGPPFG